MARALAHRGPDGVATLVLEGAAIGFTRLAIVAREELATVASSRDGRWASVANGELYEHAELRAKLERAGRSVASRADTALIPELVSLGGDAGSLAPVRGPLAAAV